MWLYRGNGLGGPSVFFRLILCDESLANMMNTNVSVMQHHNCSLADLENMLPWERAIYVALLANFMAEETQRLKQQNN